LQLNPHPSNLPQIASLDGLRAFSVMLVFVAHAGLEQYVPGGLGVTIFFFLSGFLITTLMRAEFEKTGRVNLGHFWLRRAFRILPAFYLVLLGAICLTWWLGPPGSLGAKAIAAQALYVTNYWMINKGYDGIPMGTGVYWSLAVEEHFYLLFPWIYIAMTKAGLTPRNQALTLWGLCTLVLLWRCVLILVLHTTDTDRTYMASDTRVDSILFGCALAVWRNPVLDPPVISEKSWKFVLLPAALIVLIACLGLRSSLFRETLRYSIQGAALTFVFIAAIRFKEWPLFRVLNYRPVAYLGVLSYSLYLVHFVIVTAVHLLLPYGGYFLHGVVAIVVCLMVSWAIYTFVERPFARLRRRFTD
jgi:peptidoglycan/LPS O-acetylase OafA/YrhL